MHFFNFLLDFQIPQMDRSHSGNCNVHVYERGRVSKQFRQRRQLRRTRTVSDIVKVFSSGRFEDSVGFADGHGIRVVVREAVGLKQQYVRRLAVPQCALLGRENHWSVGTENYGQFHY